MPDGEDWLSTEQAAEMWNRMIGLGAGTVNRSISGQTMRTLCRTGALERHGVEVVKGGGRFYYVQKRSLLAYIRTVAAQTIERIDAELAGGLGKE